jgi:hypothetical protein
MEAVDSIDLANATTRIEHQKKGPDLALPGVYRWESRSACANRMRNLSNSIDRSGTL